MIDETLLEAEEKMDKAVEVAKEDFGAIRTGRANPAMFTKLMVDYYGSPTPLQQLASFATPEARTIVISPFDMTAMQNIERAIRDSDLGVNPTDDGKIIRVVLPELTEERRKDYVKLARDKAEESARPQGERAARGLMAEHAPVAAPAPSRAGRDLPIAIGVGLALLAAVVASLWWRKELFIAFAALACGVALWELAHNFRRRRIALPLVPMLVGTVGILVSSYLSGPEALLVAFMLTAGGVVIWRVLDGTGPEVLRDASIATFAVAYVPFMAGFVMLMLARPDGVWRVGLFVLLCVASDTGGYVAGSILGRHPLAPTVSPKKSWEGLAGSIVLAGAVGAVGVWLVFPTHWALGIVLGIAAVATSTLGDLSESLLKRDLALKDMGRVLPGHGGVLDRLDSMLLTAPLIYILFLVLLPTARI